MSTLRALEFYSGIGGLHRALKSSGVPATVVRAFDWDQTACQVYDINYGANIVVKTDISTLSASSLLSLNASLWLLSPSCQPYTVLNPSAQGGADPRAKSFLHLMCSVLPDLIRQHCAPRWILVENVAGFETSATRRTVIKILEEQGYHTLELLLTPLQFGIPNSRLRYYLLAKARPLTFAHIHAPRSFDSCSSADRTAWRHIPGHDSPWVDVRNDSLNANPSTPEIRRYLDRASYPAQDHPCHIPDRVLEKWGRLFDIVLPSARRTCCFTRGYTQMVERAGSVLQMNEELDTTDTFDEFLRAQTQLKSKPPSDSPLLKPRPVTMLHCLRLRYFSPTELLRLFQFIHLDDDEGSIGPFRSSHVHTAHQEQRFDWPSSVSSKSKYRLIGNSVNVEVMRRLIEYLFEGDDLERMPTFVTY